MPASETRQVTTILAPQQPLTAEELVDVWTRIAESLGDTGYHLLEKWVEIEFGGGMPSLGSDDVCKYLERGQVFGELGELAFRRVESDLFGVRLILDGQPPPACCQGWEPARDGDLEFRDTRAKLYGEHDGEKMRDGRSMRGYRVPLGGAHAYGDGYLYLAVREYRDQATGKLLGWRFKPVDAEAGDSGAQQEGDSDGE